MCMHRYCNINVSEYTNIIAGRTRNAINSNLRPNRVRTSLFCDSFSNRIDPLWNNTSLDIRETKALSTFKDSLFNYFFNKFIANFDASRIQTWKRVCPHCHSIVAQLSLNRDPRDERPWFTCLGHVPPKKWEETKKKNSGREM